MKRLSRIILLAITVVVLIGVLIVYWQSRQDPNCERGMTGKCLPEGMCVAPNDAVVSCEALKQNPTKTNWP